MSCLLALLIVLPALFASDKFVPPVAFFAVTAIGTVGLYIAYVTPVYLRWRAGDSFQQRSWNLGEKWRWINPIAVIFVVLMFIILSCRSPASESPGSPISTGASSTTPRSWSHWS